MTHELIGIGYSPWTQKARWVLDHHNISYRYTEHLIMVGIPLLRIKASKWSGNVTVPALVTGSRTLMDSFNIARWADEQGGSTTLFPREHTGTIEAWNAKSETILNAGRLLTTHAMHQNNQALSEGLPGALKPLPGSVAVAKKTARYVLRKYDVPGSQSAWLETLRTGFSEFRELLGDKEYLLGEFSIADITLAASLQVIEPPDVRYVPLGPASKQCWTRPELVGEFTDLLAWRNQIFEKHGRPYQG